MKTFTLDKIKSIQDNVNHIRNICILAHVDHGKTTLADYLIASNGIISLRLAGKSRYMDSRPDEQQRGITMKSSSITLGHSINGKDYLVNVIDSPGHVDFCGEVSTAIRLCDGALIVIDVVEGLCAQTKTAIKQAWIEMIKPILVLNKIDRLILERQLTPLDAYIHLQQILEQVNALMGELYNVEVLDEDDNNEANKRTTGNSDDEEPQEINADTAYDWSTGLDDKDDSNFYFAPEQGNVVFASALDGWGFTVQDFSKWISKKHGFREEVLNKTLWGDYYLNSKTKRIMKGAQSKAKKPLFVSMVLENIWSIYDSVMIRRDKLMTDKIISSLGITLSKRDATHNDPRIILQSILTQWLSLAPNLLTVVCSLIPSPLQLSEERAEKLMCSNTTRFELFPEETKKIKEAFLGCSKDGPTIVCISKMFPVEKNTLPQYKAKPLTADEIARRRELVKANLTNGRSSHPPATPINGDENSNSDSTVTTTQSNNLANQEDEEDISEQVVFLAFARVFSGTIKTGDRLYVLHPKHDPTKITSETMVDPNAKLPDLKTDQHITCTTIEGLYILMGRGLESIEEVSAGNIVGISGLEDHVIKSATLSNSIFCPPFIDLHVPSQPILRVAIEPQNPIDIPKLIKGLKLLNQSDPCVEVKIQDSGEHVIVTTGEIHLQKCVDDLVNKFAGVQVNVSSPIVPFRETIVTLPRNESGESATGNNNVSSVSYQSNTVNSGLITSTSSLSSSNIAPTSASQTSTSDEPSFTDSFDSEGFLIITTPNKKSTIKIKAAPLPEEIVKLLEVNFDLIKKMDELYKNRAKMLLIQVSDDLSKKWTEFKEKLSQLISECKLPWLKDSFQRIWSFGPKYCGPNLLLNCLDNFDRSLWDSDCPATNSTNISKDLRSEYEYSFISGFQLATFAGPLCEEPMHGVAFLIKEWSIDPTLTHCESDPYGPFTGQIMSTVKDGCRKAFQAQSPRLMAAMYSCTIQVTSEALGKMYAVIRRRHGRTIHGDIQQGSSTFTVTAILPVIESFQFANEIRKQTSGMALPQLVFSHWEVVDIDPFWVPTTEEEYELYGEKADTQNRARIYMNAVRRRKGLPVDEKLVEHAEKQRTFKRNK